MESKYVFVVAIEGVGRVTRYACDKWHAIELAFFTYQYEQRDRKKYNAWKRRG